MDVLDKVESLYNHVQNVQKNCYKLGLILIKSGDLFEGRTLIANGQIHDNSKFYGMEFTIIVDLTISY